MYAQLALMEPQQPPLFRDDDDVYMKPMTRTILQHLERGKSITIQEAILRYNCLSLAPRIFELRELGYDIRTDMRMSFGKLIAVYHLNNE